MKTILLLCVLALFCACALPRAAKRVFAPYQPSPECVRQYVRDRLHLDWPKAVLARWGDTPVIMADPSKGAKSDWYAPDPLPHCK
jgi:hypothetical protein